MRAHLITTIKHLTGIDAIAYYLTITSFQPGVFRKQICDVKNKLLYEDSNLL